MDQKTYSQYQKFIRSKAWRKFIQKWGLSVAIFPLLVSIGVGFIWWRIFNGIESMLMALATLVVFILAFAIFYLGFFHREHVVVYNDLHEKIVRLDNELNSVKPDIKVITNPLISIVELKQDEWKEAALVCSVPFSNNPTYPTDKNNANNIRAEIYFLTKNRENISNLQGRWNGSPEPPQLQQGEQHKLESTNFPSNGAIRWLDLVMKRPNEYGFYAFSNDLYKFSKFKHSAFFINEDQFFIQVKLKGAYVQDIFEFFVDGRGSNQEFKVAFIASGKITPS